MTTLHAATICFHVELLVRKTGSPQLFFFRYLQLVVRCQQQLVYLELILHHLLRLLQTDWQQKAKWTICAIWTTGTRHFQMGCPGIASFYFHPIPTPKVQTGKKSNYLPGNKMPRPLIIFLGMYTRLGFNILKCCICFKIAIISQAPPSCTKWMQW